MTAKPTDKPKAANISRAPEPPNPVSGSGSTGISYDAPNWPIWLSMAEVTLSEAVALSLNIEPGRVTGAARDFDLRLLAAERSDTLKKTLGENGLPMVRLSDFAAWARSIKLAMPDNLSKMGADANDVQLRNMQDAYEQIVSRGDKPSQRKVADESGYDRDSQGFKDRWTRLSR